jgi:UTP--glucose-1-phosphate uridylyltransferase
MIRKVSPDKRQEIQITDAIRMLCETGRRVMGVRLLPGERRYDIGNFQSYFETFLEFALADDQYGPRLKERLRQLLGD